MDYRALTMRHHLSGSGDWAPSASDSRRLSADSAQKMRDGANSSSSSFFARSSSLLNMSDPTAPKHADRTAHNNFGNTGFTPALDRSSASPFDHTELVDRDPPLQRLLAAEVERSGIVAAARYRAARRRFLYSDPVEQEVKRASKRRPQRQVPRKESSQGRLGLLAAQPSSVRGEQSFDGSRRGAVDTAPSRDREIGRNRSINIAPVKTSVVRRLTLELPSILKSRIRTKKLHSPAAGRVSIPPSAGNFGKTKSFLVPSEPTCTMDLLKMRSLPVLYDDEVSVGPDGTNDRRDAAGTRDDGLKSSFTNECGWLPWPERDDEDGSSMDDSGDGGELLEPFREQSRGERLLSPWPSERKGSSSNEELAGTLQRTYWQGEDSFVQWPDVPREIHARAV